MIKEIEHLCQQDGSIIKFLQTLPFMLINHLLEIHFCKQVNINLLMKILLEQVNFFRYN